MFQFAYYPILILIVPVLLLLWIKYKKGTDTLTFSMTERAAHLSGIQSFYIYIPLWLRTTTLLLLVLTAARPQLANMEREIKSPGVDIMLVLDTSGSMQAMDFTINDNPVDRLTAVKKVVSDFINKREYDRMGLVVFGEEAYTQAPLTLDKGLLLNLVDRMQIGMAGDSTALGSAIAIGGKRLKDLDAKSKILILLTDGRSNDGDLSPARAAEAVAAFGVKIYTIGVGGYGPAPFPMKTFFGTQMMKREVDLDEDTLKDVARISGGKYYRASDSKKLEEIYDIINKAEKREAKVKEFFNFKELYRYFLYPALFLLLLEIVLSSTVLRVIP